MLLKSLHMSLQKEQNKFLHYWKLLGAGWHFIRYIKCIIRKLGITEFRELLILWQSA